MAIVLHDSAIVALRRCLRGGNIRAPRLRRRRGWCDRRERTWQSREPATTVVEPNKGAVQRADEQIEITVTVVVEAGDGKHARRLHDVVCALPRKREAHDERLGGDAGRSIRPAVAIEINARGLHEQRPAKRLLSE